MTHISKPALDIFTKKIAHMNRLIMNNALLNSLINPILSNRKTTVVKFLLQQLNTCIIELMQKTIG